MFAIPQGFLTNPMTALPEHPGWPGWQPDPRPSDPIGNRPRPPIVEPGNPIGGPGGPGNSPGRPGHEPVRPPINRPGPIKPPNFPVNNDPPASSPQPPQAPWALRMGVLAAFNVAAQATILPFYITQGAAMSVKLPNAGTSKGTFFDSFRYAHAAFKHVHGGAVNGKAPGLGNFYHALAADIQRGAVRSFFKTGCQTLAFPWISKTVGEEWAPSACAAFYSVGEALLVGPFDQRRVLIGLGENFEWKQGFRGALANMSRQFLVWWTYFKTIQQIGPQLEARGMEKGSTSYNLSIGLISGTGIVFTSGIEDNIQRALQVQLRPGLSLPRPRSFFEVFKDAKHDGFRLQPSIQRSVYVQAFKEMFTQPSRYIGALFCKSPAIICLAWFTIVGQSILVDVDKAYAAYQSRQS